tara:strand:+ start:24 stop:2087 length:2064 start_codon:yes stop_codon:yes gene_type:complete
MSFAEKLAMAGQPLATSIQQRGDVVQKATLAQRGEGKQAQASALTAALGQAQREQESSDAIKLAEAKKKENMIKNIPVSIFNKLLPEEQKRIIMGEEKTINGVPRDIFDKLLESDQNKILGLTSGPVKGIPEDIFLTLSKEDQARVILGDPQGVNGVPRDIFDTLDEPSQKLILGTTTEAKYQNFFRLNSNGSVDVKSVDISTNKGRKEAENLLSDNYTTSESSAKQQNAIELAEIAQLYRIELFDKKVNAEIDAEQRALGRELDKEQRDLMYFEKRLALEIEAKVNEEQRALGRQLNAEERANIEADRRKLLDEEIQIRKEIRALENRDNIEVREVDGQILVFDKTKPNEAPTVLFGEPDLPEPEIRVFTLQQGGQSIRVFEDINSNAGKALLKQVNEQNAANPGSASFEKPTTVKNTPKGYLIPDEGVRMSYDGGKTYVGLDGKQKNIPGGAFTVSDTVAYDVMRREKLVAHSKKSLEAMDALITSNMDLSDPLVGKSLPNGEVVFKDEGTVAEVKDAYAAARSGTGFWSKIAAGLDAVVGGLSAGKFSMFKGTQEARKFVKMVRVLGRSALSVSPRFAVADLEAVAQLFPNEEALFTNPVTEANKLSTLVKYLDEEKRRILGLFKDNAPMDKSQVAVLNQKIFEIDKLTTMLGPITSGASSEISIDAQREAEDIMQQNVNKGKN